MNTEEDEEKAARLDLENLPGDWVDALRETSLRGRCETIIDEGGVEWLIDGAHTADSLAQVSKLFMGKPRAQGDKEVRVLMFNQQERDTAALVRELSRGAAEGGGGDGLFEHAIFTRNEAAPSTAGNLSVQEAAMAAMQELSPETECSVRDNVTDAVRHVQQLAARTEGRVRVLVTGSFHLLRAVLQVLRPDEVD